jgi:hypothetical protein
MSAALSNSRRDEARAERILNLCKIRAKEKGCRVKKLKDADARDDVINRAAWRLLLNQQRFGNIREMIEADFWDIDGDTRNELIDRALDAERKAYTRASEASGGSELLDPTTQGSLERFTEAGNEFANEPTFVIERGEQLEREERAAADRKQIEAEENARLAQAVAAYERKLRRKHRTALRMVVGPRLPNGVIAARCGVAEATVAKIRADVCDLADAILTNPEDALETLLREVETLKKEMAVIKAERRRARFLLNHTPEEFEAFRAWAAPFCEALGSNVDDLLGPMIAPKSSDGVAS